MVEGVAGPLGKALELEVGGVPFALDVGCVRHVARASAQQVFPEAPFGVAAVVSFRDEIVPVVDLRELLSLSHAPVSERRRHVFAQVEGKTLALLVDGVGDVFSMRPDDAREIPPLVREREALYHCVKAYVREGRFVYLLELSRLASRIGRDASWSLAPETR